MAREIIIGNSVAAFLRELTAPELENLVADIRQVMKGGPPYPGIQAPKKHRLVVLGSGYTMVYRKMTRDELVEYDVRRGFVVVELASVSDASQP